MVFLSSPPLSSRRNLGHDAALPPLLVGLFRNLARNLLLLRVMEVDRRTVLRAGIGTLLVQRRGIVRLVEELEELCVRDLCGVKNDLRGFSICVAVSNSNRLWEVKTYGRSCRRRRRGS